MNDLACTLIHLIHVLVHMGIIEHVAPHRWVTHVDGEVWLSRMDAVRHALKYASIR